MCTFGMAPSNLQVIPGNRDANIGDKAPMVNVRPFGMCRSMANPQVAAASAAAMGALIPAACIPVCATPWVPGDPMRMVQGMPALTPESKLMCAYAGVITMIKP